MFTLPPGRSHCLDLQTSDGGYRKVIIDGVLIPAMASDEPGHGGFVSTVAGWLDPASSGPTLSALLLTSGAMYPTRITRGAHNFTLTGYCDGSSTEVEDFAAWLAALAYRWVDVGIQGDGGEMTYRTALCQSELTNWHGGTSFDWSLDCTAPDPIRYGDWRYTSGAASTITVHNAGTAPTRLLVEAQHAANALLTLDTPAGPTIYNNAGAGLVRLDPRFGGSVTLAGSPSLGVRALNWPTVQPGSDLTMKITGSTSWRVGVRDGWW